MRRHLALLRRGRPHLRFLGVDKRLRLRAVDRVRADLTLEAFRYFHEVDGSTLRVEGRSDGRRLVFDVHTAGGHEAKEIALEEPLYPRAPWRCCRSCAA